MLTTNFTGVVASEIYEDWSVIVIFWIKTPISQEAAAALGVAHVRASHLTYRDGPPGSGAIVVTGPRDNWVV